MADIKGYKESVISFIDILGFREIVGKRKQNDILNILKATRKFFQYKRGTSASFSLEEKFTNFSDTIIRSVPINSDENKSLPMGIFFLELIDLLHAQCDLIANGVLVRGAVTIGQIYHDEYYVFGPGLNAAYELEKSAAIYPRIVIDTKALLAHKRNKLLRSIDNDYAYEKDELKELLRCSSDGVWFIDYLRAIAEEMDKPEVDYWKFLAAHKNLIVSYSSKHKKLDSVALKHNWLAKYHNEVIEGFPKDFKPTKLKKLVITNKEVKTFHNL